MNLTTLQIILAILALVLWLLGTPIAYGFQRHGSINPSIWAALCWPLAALWAGSHIAVTNAKALLVRVWLRLSEYGFGLAERWTPAAPGKWPA